MNVLPLAGFAVTVAWAYTRSMRRTDMKRLTWECELDGFADIGLHDGVTVDAAICRLSAYERTGLEPEEIIELKARMEGLEK